MSHCVFCKIIENEYSSYKVYEDDTVLAFLDLSQACLGHTLVVPKQHVKNITECDTVTLSKVMTVVQKIASSMMANLGAKGVNVISNMNEAAGQTVMHFHIHVIPRYNDQDGFKISFVNHSNISKETMVETASKIAQGISL